MIWESAFILFCITMLWIGLRASQGVKDLKSYFLSGQNFGTFALTATIIASFVGGGVVMGTAEKSFQFGIAHALGLLGFGAQLFLTGLFIAPRMAKFRSHLSLGEIVGQSYGKMPQILTGLLWLSFCIGILTVQISAMGNLVTSFLGYDRTVSIVLSASIVVFYCYMGGIRAILATDILQFTLVALALVLVAVFGLQYVGGFNQLLASIPTEHLAPTSHLTGWQLGMVFISFLLGDALIPPVFQRLQMGKNVKVTRKAYVWAGILLFPICFIVLMHGFIALAINPSLPKEQITFFLFKNTLPLPIAIVGLMGFISVTMSSADSYLNAAAGSLVNDVIAPLVGQKMPPKRALAIAKFTTVLLGLAAVFFAIAVQDIMDILLKTYQFWGPIMVVPLIGLFFNRQLPRYGFYTSILTGGLTVVAWNTFDLETLTHLSSLIAGIFSNAIVYVGIYVFHMKAKAKATQALTYQSFMENSRG